MSPWYQIKMDNPKIHFGNYLSFLCGILQFFVANSLIFWEICQNFKKNSKTQSTTFCIPGSSRQPKKKEFLTFSFHIWLIARSD